MGLTRELGEFVAGAAYDRLPPDAIAVAKLGFVDCVGVMIAGSGEASTRIVADTVLGDGGKPEASVLLTATRAPAPAAAWVNGTAAHALDYDDAGGHRSAILVPALLAEGEALGASGRDMICAYVAGFEVWSELAARERGHLHERGWHPTGIYGAVAAAAACAKLRGLDAPRSAIAIAIAASSACGIVANFGTMVKPFHAGNSARAGLVAARLAQNGFTANACAMEHERGFLSAVSQHGDFDRTSPSKLGLAWRIGTQGVSIKKFPTCYCTHRAIDAMLELVAANSIAPQDVEEIVVAIGRTQKAILHADAPETGLEGKFSIQFAMACALLEKRVTLAELVDAVVHRADVRAMMKRVRVAPLSEYDPAMPQYSPYDQVSVRLKSGRMLESGRIERARGHITRPLAQAELYAKFASCLQFARSPLDARATFDAFDRLETQRAGWLAALTMPPTGAKAPAAAAAVH